MENRCKGCPTVPVVSKSLGYLVVSELPEVLRGTAMMAALSWISETHEGLSVYLGISGRPYTNEEKDAIAVETGVVAGLSCPFFRDDGCIIGGLGADYNRVAETNKAPYNWLPTIVALVLGYPTLKALVKHKLVADAKVADLTRNEGFLTKDATGQIYVG